MGNKNMSMRWRTIVATVLLAVFVAFCGMPGGNLAAQAQDQTAFGDLLKKTALERSIVLSKLRDYNPVKYIQQGGQELDAYWQSDKVTAAFQRHYQDIEKIVQQVVIDPRFDTLDAILAQYKSFYDDSKLNEISDAFVQDSLRAIQGTQETFIDKTLDDFGQYLNDVYGETQRNIGNDLDRLVQKQFEYWPELTSSLAPISVNTRNFQGPEAERKAPMAGFAGALILILRKQISNTITRVLGAKLVGKVGAKFVPVVGTLLIVWDVIDATQAKVQLESSLRDIFVQEYRTALTPEQVWQGSREEVQTQYRKEINRWVDNTKRDIEKMMEVAVLIQNPSFEAYAKEQVEKGYSLEDLYDQLRSLHEDFGPLVNELKIEKMYYIQSLLPRQALAERGFLPRLIDVFGADFVPLVDHHKRVFFEAAWEIGPENLRAILARDLDLREVYDSYQKLLSRDDSANAKKGFILAWQMGLDLRPGKINTGFLEKLFAEREMAQQLLRDELPQDKLIGILANDKVRGIVANVYAKDAILGGAFARGFEIVEIDNRYGDPQKVTDLINLFHAQHPSADRAISDRFIQEIRENSWQSDIFSRHGQTGLEIAAAHIENEPSAYELEMAKKAIALYEKGYVLEVVKDRQAVDYAYDYSALGQWYFNLTYPIQKNLGSLGTLMLGLVVLVLVVVTLGYLGGFLFRRFRPAPALATVAAPPEAYPVYGVGKNEPLKADPRAGGMPQPVASPSLPPGPSPASPDEAGPAAKPAALPPAEQVQMQTDGGGSSAEQDDSHAHRGEIR